MQLCFLTNNDITGGNSGSPMFDGKGRLIGLAFDGNWDSLSSDINFDRQLARCIGVDIPLRALHDGQVGTCRPSAQGD
jgi:S1-C subfamily serine protease